MRHPTLHTYLINLPRAGERLRQMQAVLDAAGLPFTRIEAIDGRAFPLPCPEFHELSHRLMTGRRPIPAEIGCYLSHMKAINAFLASTADYALILEDDARFAPTLPSLLAKAVARGRLWDVLRLQTVNTDRAVPVVRLDATASLGVSFTRSKGAAAYVLNRRAAAAFRRYLLPMRLAYDIAFDLEYLVGLKALAVTPCPVVADEGSPTQIQFGSAQYKLPRWRYLTVFPFRAVIEVLRVVMRSVLFVRTATVAQLTSFPAAAEHTGPASRRAA
jgi:glycosyl transferase family 25